MRGTIGFLHREGKRKSGSLPCEEQVESVLSLPNPHLCIPPSTLSYFLCFVPPPYTSPTTPTTLTLWTTFCRTCNKLLSQNCPPPQGLAELLPLLKRRGWPSVPSENLPQLHLLDRAWFSPVYWFIGLLRQWNINKLVAKGDKYVRMSSKPSNCFIQIKSQRSHSWNWFGGFSAFLASKGAFVSEKNKRN